MLALVLVLALPAAAAPGLDTLRLEPNERIVIVAPHPDDEVLACGGLIQQALALEDSVWVVYVTAGDGSWPAAWRVTGNMFPGPKDYLELGAPASGKPRLGPGSWASTPRISSSLDIPTANWTASSSSTTSPRL